MTCYLCHAPGEFIGLWRQHRTIIGKRYKCTNPACWTEYEDIDGNEKKAKPTWGETRKDGRDG